MSIKYRPGILLVLLFGLIYLGGVLSADWEEEQDQFNGERAYVDVLAQIDMGPRTLDSKGHAEIRSWMVDELNQAGWRVNIQVGDYNGQPIYNLIATRPGRGSSEKYNILIGAHYDSRIFADKDPDPARRIEPVPGANDGASGVAVLIELARVLPKFVNVEITIVFFDAEDNGGISGMDWIIGSRYFVENMTIKPDAVVIVDMVGDIDQNIFLEQTSDVDLAAEIWAVADDLGIDSFIFEGKYSIIDDHTPFLAEGVAAVDIIDFDYSYWHTTQDTPDKVSAQSLQNVGLVLQNWLKLKDESLGR